MFSDLLQNLYDTNEQIRLNSEHTIIQLRETNTALYIQELMNIISSSNDEQKQIHTRIQNISIILLGQIITHPNYFKEENFNSSFYEQLSTLLLPKLYSEDHNLARSSAILFGESLGFLIRDKNHPDVIPNLINILQDSISSNSKNIHFLLISVVSLINSTYLEIDQTIQIFQSLFQIFQITNLSNESLQAITAMVEEISDTFTQITSSVQSAPINDGHNSFVALLMQFFNQLIQIASTDNENNALCFNCLRLFFKKFPLSFYHENLDKVLQIVKFTITTSINESVLLASIHFLKTVLRREIKLKENGNYQFSPFFNFSHFDTFITPLIRVLTMIPNDGNLDLYSYVVDYSNLYYAIQDLIMIFVNSFPERAPKILIPLIMNLSAPPPDQSFTFSYLGTNMEMSPCAAIETSLFLLCLIIRFSTNLPPTDFIISFLGTNLSGPFVRIRFQSIRALKYYLKREIIPPNNDDSETESNEINSKLALLLPAIAEHVLDEHPIIARYAIRAISKFSVFPSYYNIFKCEILFPLFLNVIETQNNYDLLYDTFEYLEKIINNREIKEVMTLIEPIINLLSLSNQKNSNSILNEKLRDIIIIIIQKVTIAALPYHDLIYSLLIDNIQPQDLINLAHFSKIFANDNLQAFQNTTRIVLKFLIDSSDIVDDYILRNEVVYYCCFSISLLSSTDNFIVNVKETANLLLNYLSKDISNLNILIGLSALCLYQKKEMEELIPTIFQIVSQINIDDFIQSRENRDFDDRIMGDEIIASCLNIVTSSYDVAPNDQNVINIIFRLINSIQFIDEYPVLVLEALIDLLLSLDMQLLFEIDKSSNVVIKVIKESKEYDYLNELIFQLEEKIRSIYDLSDTGAEYENDIDE